MAVKMMARKGAAQLATEGTVLNGAKVEKGGHLVNRNVTVGGKYVNHEILGVSGASVQTTGWADATNRGNGTPRNSRFRRSQVVAGQATTDGEHIATALKPTERGAVRPVFKTDMDSVNALEKALADKGHSLVGMLDDGTLAYVLGVKPEEKTVDKLVDAFGEDNAIVQAVRDNNRQGFDRAMRENPIAQSWKVVGWNPLVVEEKTEIGMNVDAIANLIGADHPIIEDAFAVADKKVDDVARMALMDAASKERVDVRTVRRDQIDKKGTGRNDPLAGILARRERKTGTGN